MTNPVFTSNKVFTDRTPAGYPAMPGYQVGVGGAAQTLPQQTQFQSPTDADTSPLPGTQTSQTPGQFQLPQPGYGQGFPNRTQPVSPATTRPMTLDDVLIKTIICFGVLLFGGAVSWFMTLSNPGIGATLTIVGSLAAFVLSLVVSFKKGVSPALILSYAFMEGIALGAISSLFSMVADGAVPKAIGATLVTTIVMLVFFKTKLIRNSPTLMRVVWIGLASIAVFYLLNFAVSLIFPAANFYNLTIGGFPLWIVVSLAAIVLAALSLVTDFDYILQAVENRAPVDTAWTAAFGLMVTLVWLYIEFLRLFSYFTSDN